MDFACNCEDIKQLRTKRTKKLLQAIVQIDICRSFFKQGGYDADKEKIIVIDHVAGFDIINVIFSLRYGSDSAL